DQHVLLVLLDHYTALATGVPAMAGIRRPLQAAPFQRLPVAAVRAADVPAALVAACVGGVDAAHTLDLGRAHLQPLVRRRERGGAAVDQLLRVIAGAQGVGEAGELVDDQGADAGGLQAHRVAGVLQV